MKSVSRVVDRKILFIPVVFLFIRLWSMLRYLLSLSPEYLSCATSGSGQGLSQFLIAMEVRSILSSHMTNMYQSHDYRAVVT